MEREREQLKSIIDEWNVNRLDLFELSQPNEDLEFHGVMRFYFQDAGQKIATKCIRVSSTASTQDVINILIEKFRPDIRMLSIPEYALYETYENGEERKLAEEEKPLLVQLNWHHDDREGRFLLRRMDEKSYLPGFDPAQSNFKRKLSKREKKEKRKAEKELRLQNKQTHQQNQQSGNQSARENGSGDAHAVSKAAEKLYTEVPENSFTRSISNPEAVMRRRRKQKLEKKLQQMCQEGGVDAGGTLRIFGETLNPDVPYKTLLLSTQDTAQYVVREILDKYGKEKEEHSNYCLVQLIVPHELSAGTAALSDLNGNNGSSSSSSSAIREYILDDEDCPLAIEKQHQRIRGSLSFHIRRRPADYVPRKRKKKPLHLKPEFEVKSEEILQRLHSLNPTTNNHVHATASVQHNNHPHLLLNNNNHQQQQQQMPHPHGNHVQQQVQEGAAVDSAGITSAAAAASSRDQQMLSEAQVAAHKYTTNENSERSASTSTTSQHFVTSEETSAAVPASPAPQSAIPNHQNQIHPSHHHQQHPTTPIAGADGHFFPGTESHQQTHFSQHQQQDRRSGSDQGQDGTAASSTMNGNSSGAIIGPNGQLLAKRQNTGPETEVIIFQKGTGGMGLSIVATQGLGQQRLGIYIKNVVAKGAADQDGRLQAGDQLLAVDGNSLVGVTQEQAAELISKTGPTVTLEVARNAAAYYGLATLLNQPSPQVSRHPRIMSHSQSYVNQPSQQQAQRQHSSQSSVSTSGMPHYMSQPYLSQQQASNGASAGMQTQSSLSLQQQQQMQPSYANAPLPAVATGPLPHLMQQQSQITGSSAAVMPPVLTSNSSATAALLQSQSSLIPEERLYQNVGLYRQPQPPLPNPPNGLPSNGSSVRLLNNPYPHPSHHSSYSSLHALPAAGSLSAQQQMNSSTLPTGRPLSTVYPNSNSNGNNMMGRVTSMAQYPTYGGPSSQMTLSGQPHQPMYRSGHTGSVPVLHANHGQQWSRDMGPYPGPMYQPGNGTIPGMSHPNHSQQQQLYGRSGGGIGMSAGMLPQPSRVSIVSTKGLVDGEQPPTGYRYVPSAYPTKSMDGLNNNSINNNNSLMMNGHNNNNNSMSQTLWRRNKNNSGNSHMTQPSLESSAQLVEEQEERLRLLRLEEMKRHHELEVAHIQMAEDRLLKEAKTRRGQDEEFGAKAGRLYHESESLPPQPKSPPPVDPLVHQPPLVSHSSMTTSRVAFRNHLIQPASSSHGEEIRQQAYPASALRPNGDLSNGYMTSSSSAGPLPPKKNVSWNDTHVQQQQTAVAPSPVTSGNQVPSPNASSSDVIVTNGTGSGSSSGITLEDIDEVLGSSQEQDEPSALLPNTPNVIGSQEVYRDPRERMIQEKMKNKPQATSQGPEKLSFKEKMQMFAIQQQQQQQQNASAQMTSASSSASAVRSGLRDGENAHANAIPEEET